MIDGMHENDWLTRRRGSENETRDNLLVNVGGEQPKRRHAEICRICGYDRSHHGSTCGWCGATPRRGM